MLVGSWQLAVSSLLKFFHAINLAPSFNLNSIYNNLLIINATPLGTFPKTDVCPDIPYQFLTNRHLLFDVVYNPAETLFMKKGRDAGATALNGEEMLIGQAIAAWEIWNR